MDGEYFMAKPYFLMDDLGGKRTPIFGNTHFSQSDVPGWLATPLAWVFCLFNSDHQDDYIHKVGSSLWVASLAGILATPNQLASYRSMESKFVVVLRIHKM